MVEAAAASQALAEASRPAAEAQPSSQGYEGAGEVLLDLGDYRQGRSALDDEFVLDIDLDESPEPSPAEPAFSAAAFRDRESYRSLPKIQPRYANAYGAPATISSEAAATTDTLPATVEYERWLTIIEATDYQVELTASAAAYSAQPSVQSTPVSAQSCRPR